MLWHPSTAQALIAVSVEHECPQGRWAKIRELEALPVGRDSPFLALRIDPMCSHYVHPLHLQLTECFVSFGTLVSVCLMVRWNTKTAYAALAFTSAFSASRRAMRSSGDSLRCTRSMPQL